MERPPAARQGSGTVTEDAVSPSRGELTRLRSGNYAAQQGEHWRQRVTVRVQTLTAAPHIADGGNVDESFTTARSDSTPSFVFQTRDRPVSDLTWDILSRIVQDRTPMAADIAEHESVR